MCRITARQPCGKPVAHPIAAIMTSACVVLPRKARWPRQLVIQTTHRTGLFARFARPLGWFPCPSSPLERLVRASDRHWLPVNPLRPLKLGSSLRASAVLDSRRSSDGTALLDPFTDLSSTCPSPGALHEKVRIVNGLAPSCPLP